MGTGCPGCKALYETVIRVVAEIGIAAEVIKEEDLLKIIAYNVIALPALVVDGVVVSKGKSLSSAEVKALLIK